MSISSTTRPSTGPFSTGPLAAWTAAFMTAVAVMPLTAAQAQTPMHRAPLVQRAPVFRPATTFRPQTHVNRHPPRFTQTPPGGHGGNHHHHTNSNNSNNPVSGQQVRPSLPNFTPRPGPQGAPTTQTLLKAGPGNPALKPGPALLKPAFPIVTMKGKFWPILKGQKPMWFGGKKHFFMTVGLLGVVLIGDSYWYPDGYVSIAWPLCAGFTPDGCQLEWRMVDFEDGGSAAQCVQYCPQAGPPPAHVVSLPWPPALARSGSCQLTIYAEQSFGGLSAPTSDNQPLLSETGWKDEIGSIQVQAGTWDFFSAENFGGESIRMSAGSYPMLAPEWNKRIGSFMCIEPGPTGA